MNDERRNEIWAMLPSDFKATVRGMWLAFKDGSTADMALRRLFGSHNITAPAEDEPKAPKFNIGDIVMFKGKPKRVVAVRDYHYNTSYNVVTLNGQSPLWYNEDELEPYISELDKISEEIAQNSLDVAENVKSRTEGDACFDDGESNHFREATKKIDYAQYRLDLARDIAVTLINNTEKAYRIGSIITHDAVAMANDIINRLKETDNAD